MKIREYISTKIQKFGIFSVPDADLIDICEKTGLNIESDVSDYSVGERELAFVKYIPELLLFIDSINEGGFTVSRADTVRKIKLYYAFKCKELDIEDLLNMEQKTSVIYNASNLW